MKIYYLLYSFSMIMQVFLLGNTATNLRTITNLHVHILKMTNEIKLGVSVTEAYIYHVLLQKQEDIMPINHPIKQFYLEGNGFFLHDSAPSTEHESIYRMLR